MKRRVGLVMLLLLAGAIVNMAVAWSCAWWADLDINASGPVEDDAQVAAWIDHRAWENDADGPFRPVWFMDERAFGRRRAHLSAEVISGRILMPADVVLEIAGWPLPSLQGHHEPVWTGTIYRSRDHAIVRLPIGSGITPLRPIWPGFAINTLLYAGVLWTLFAAAAVLRRKRRLKRGLCPKCAYPIGKSDVCTECGTPVSPALEGGG